MDRITLTPSQARAIILHAAGLSKRGQFGKGKEAVYKLIDHLGFIQIDTNYVVERAHHHAIASRIPDYKPEWLEQLQADGRIVEAWTFATGYMPTHLFHFTLPVKESFLLRWKSLTPTENNLMNKVLDRIGREGPLMASDFENDRVTKSTGWWDWRPSKLALERLHLTGKLMTTRKENFLKVYDLPENVLPKGIDMTMPTAKEYARYVIRRCLKAYGIAYMKEIVFSTRYTKSLVKEEIQKMIDEGEVSNVGITGLKTSQLYMLSDYRKKKISLSGDAFILSPFDVLNVYRHRLRDFFNFDYQVECFVPKAKRKYGYFSLPILIGDTFVARMDSKADRKDKVLTIYNLHFEPLKITNVMIAKISEAIKAFAKFNKCKEIVIAKSNNKALLKTIQAGVVLN
ncbi:MAG TPA: crosslink repair DNA glycosylase YcaQ family protein [Cyclobacteriaceae bacterium]|jgi:hypothetical protein|nr:crosslink repair DNA glycosylase YcaQ family protein [Cyclobacteriaceae bacterium]